MLYRINKNSICRLIRNKNTEDVCIHKYTIHFPVDRKLLAMNMYRVLVSYKREQHLNRKALKG